MIWNLTFFKFTNNSDEASFELVDKLNTNSKQEESESSNQPFPEKAIEIAKSDSKEEPPVKRQKTEETSKMSCKNRPEELEESIILNELIGSDLLRTLNNSVNLDEIKQIVKFEEDEELLQSKELEKPQRAQNIIQYSHITEETFDFFVELSKTIEEIKNPIIKCFSDDIDKQYKEKICEIIQRSDFSFSISSFSFYNILKTKNFNNSELIKIANLDFNADQNDSNKLSYFECFLLRFVHILTYQDYKDYNRQNIEVINTLIDLLNEYIKFYFYFLKLKDVVIMINNDDIDNLQNTKKEFTDLINQNFLSHINSFTKDEKFSKCDKIIESINRHLKNSKIFSPKEIRNLILFEYVKDVSKIFDDKLDKNQKREILQLISYMYLGYIHYSCKTDLILTKDCYFNREKSRLLNNFINLMNRIPWNIEQ
ncbi:hypothetical protein A0H76_989 [Hepatospora eriocheir]|uniref:Uncharacterized protein n=1 Tax=Hepatospora eriocheir TaxID=1081669 RepID=A0A1X0QI42_9MICR|nr:hypothetical protein A0H76_989 [Hepatospora eriocheir]